MELHNYETGVADCASLESDLVGDGFSALFAAGEEDRYPVVVTEWGHDQMDGSYEGVYASCLHSYLPSVEVGWMSEYPLFLFLFDSLFLRARLLGTVIC